MPTCETNHQNAQTRQQDAVGQYGLFIAIKPVAPICTEQGQQRYGNDKMRPSWRTRPDARHQQKFCCTGKPCKHTEQKTGPCGPKCGARPKQIARPPVQDVRTEYTEGKSNREGNAHGVDRVTKHGNTRFRFAKARQLADGVNQFFTFFIVFMCRHIGILRRPFLTLLTLVALSGCEGGLSIVDPAGPAARTIATLWWVMLISGALIFGLVMVLLFFAFKNNAPRDEARQVRVWVVGLGLLFPMVVFAMLLAYGLVMGERLLPLAGNDVVKVGAQGRLSAWSFTYEDAPENGTQDVLHIPAGRPVDVAITTIDVIHSFWVPRLAGKLDAIPGRVNTLRIEADLPGRYQGVSAEFSGAGYESFTFTVIAHDLAGWNAFLNGEIE